MEEAMTSVHRLSFIDRKIVRDCFEKRFTARRMADDYLKVYDSLIVDRRLENKETIPIKIVTDIKNVKEVS